MEALKLINPTRHSSMKVDVANDRLYPSLFHERRYHLVVLRSQLESIASTHLPQKPHLVLVDFGCGGMPYKPIFKPYVAQYIGVDLPANPVAERHVSEDGKIMLADGFADVVLSTQVLEHVMDPLKYLHECHRILKPGGLFILSTHGYWRYHPDPIDLWRWTCTGLRKIVDESGFQIVQLEGVMGLASTAVQLFQDALANKMPRFVRPIFTMLMQRLVALMDRVHSPMERKRDSCVFVIVASKGERAGGMGLEFAKQ